MDIVETIAITRAALVAFHAAPADVEDRERGISLCDMAARAITAGDERGRHTLEGAVACLRDLRECAARRMPRSKRRPRPTFLRGAELRQHMIACRSLHCRICM